MTESLLKYHLLTCLMENTVCESFVEFIFRIYHPKTLQNKFCNTCAFFCMLPLKTVRFYNSEIAFIFNSVKELFAEVNLKKKFQHSCRRIFILEKTLWFTRKITIIHTNRINSFHKTTYLGYWITEYWKISFANNFFVVGNNLPYLLFLVLLAL